jgi:hypothetical protein
VTITSNETWDNLTYINTNYPGWEDGVNIDPGVTLTIDGINGLTLGFNGFNGISNSYITLNEGSFLEVKNNAKLTCNNSNQFWGGIKAIGDITINNYIQNPTFDPNTYIANYWSALKNPLQTLVKINSYSEIRRAEEGVNVSKGAIVEFENAQFINNIIGYNNENLNTYTNSYASHIMNTNFNWDNSMSSFENATGIQLTGMYGLNIGNCNFKDFRSSLCIYQRATGINGNSSGFFVGESGNSDCVDNFGCPANCYSGIIGNGCNFENLRYGIIYSNGYDVSYSFLCRRNNFNNNINSIVSNDSKNNKIYENNFNGDRTFINSLYYQSGCVINYTPNYLIKHIEFSNANNLEIYNNNLDFTGFNIYYVHSLANNNSVNKQRIQNNIFANYNNQTVASNNVFGVYAEASTPNLGIFCNTFYSMGVDIEISSSGSVFNPMVRKVLVSGNLIDAGANNQFSLPLANRFRIRNNSANILDYRYSSNVFNSNPNINIFSSTNTNSSVNNTEYSCALTCSDIINHDNSGNTAVNDLSFGYFKLFPNPFNNIISLTSTKEINKIEVYNNIGQIVYSVYNLKELEYSINLNTLESGLYFIKINGEFNQKIVKQ